ncbi:MAG TPA: NUDIX hydrolase [Acidimicrobiales bacterium]|nr:NUDIX hydrolase [Acidimicrobiales bacterium]HUC05501.1 NUDIX hydrolase [Acidimicrobiales bacterium]
MSDGELVNLRCSVLFFRNESVLLCRRTDEHDAWVLPGGTPAPGEGSAAAARREVAEETGIQVSAERVAFVLETTSWDNDHHLIEIVFMGAERDRSAEPIKREDHLAPFFVALDQLDQIHLRPPIAGYIKGIARTMRTGDNRATAAYLGNVWRPTSPAPSPKR